MKCRLISRGCAALAALVIAVPACSTTDLLKQFNSGLLDSKGDPDHEPEARHRAMVKALIVHEVMDGYFTQGTENGAIRRWLLFAAQQPHAFVRAVHMHALYSSNSLGVVRPRPSASVPSTSPLVTPAGGANVTPASDASTSVDASTPSPTVQVSPADVAFAPASTPKQRFTALGAYLRRTPLPAGISMCDGTTIKREQASELADALRFDAAVERAGTAVTALAIEGIVNVAEIEQGAREAFIELEHYIGNRGWRRQFDRHVNGLVVKGGASTGLYSAGVVWVALNLIDRCLEDATCKAKTADPSFSLVSGTSTGAMISVVTDMFNSATTSADRRIALDRLANWFTCTGSADLYCVRDASALAMLKDQKGLMEFNGLESLLAKNVTCAALRNPSELVLNTVDFRTGTLYDLSDQNELRRPSDVVQGALASAVLPFIAKPVPHLPVDYAPDKVEQTYLDGGIRSELPILSLVRRGAERVLVVSSSASVIGEEKHLESGLRIVTRYIEVSLGGVTEGEIQHAERHVESVRLAEMDNCANSAAVKSACSEREQCVTAFCESRWNDVCSATPRATERDVNPLDLSGQRLASLWQTRSFFRDEEKTEALHGYDFDPVKQRQLFLAGAEDARVRCVEIANLLGFPVEKLGPKLVAWCSPALAPTTALCPAGVSHATDLQKCKEPPAVASVEVCR
jgi:predicted acylesterase/phospholipase RssA